MLKETDIQQKVLERIRAGEISMRPKLYFVARVVALALVALLALALAVFVLSFLFFSITESGEQFLLGFGRHGLMAFITLFPWGPFLIALALIVLLDVVVRYFKFGYRVSMLEIFLIALTVVVAAGVAINFTPLHRLLLESADRGELPLVGPLYEGLHAPHQDQGVYRGIISSIQSDQFVIVHDDGDRDTDDGTSTVTVPPGFDTSALYVGERVYVGGKSVLDTVSAYGIQEFAPDDR